MAGITLSVCSSVCPTCFLTTSDAHGHLSKLNVWACVLDTHPSNTLGCQMDGGRGSLFLCAILGTNDEVKRPEGPLTRLLVIYKSNESPSSVTESVGTRQLMIRVGWICLIKTTFHLESVDFLNKFIICTLREAIVQKIPEFYEILL